MEQDRAGKVLELVGEWGLAEQDNDRARPAAEVRVRDKGPDVEWVAAWVVDRVAADKAAAPVWGVDKVEADRKKGEWIMPGGDRTGPMGMGAMSGRGAGNCAGYGAPGYMNAGFGGGMGFGRRGGGFGGRGAGRGWRNMFYATGRPGGLRAGMSYAQPQYTPEQELAELKQQAEYFGNALEEIRKQIQELEAKPAKK